MRFRNTSRAVALSSSSSAVFAFGLCPLPGDNVSIAPGIGLLAERSLHAGLKDYLAREGDQFEVKLGRFVIDIVGGELLIEIQARHLYPLRSKLLQLCYNSDERQRQEKRR